MSQDLFVLLDFAFRSVPVLNASELASLLYPSPAVPEITNETVNQSEVNPTPTRVPVSPPPPLVGYPKLVPISSFQTPLFQSLLILTRAARRVTELRVPDNLDEDESVLCHGVDMMAKAAAMTASSMCAVVLSELYEPSPDSDCMEIEGTDSEPEELANYRSVPMATVPPLAVSIQHRDPRVNEVLTQIASAKPVYKLFPPVKRKRDWWPEENASHTHRWWTAADDAMILSTSFMPDLQQHPLVRTQQRTVSQVRARIETHAFSGRVRTVVRNYTESKSVTLTDIAMASGVPLYVLNHWYYNRFMVDLAVVTEQVAVYLRTQVGDVEELKMHVVEKWVEPPALASIKSTHTRFESKIAELVENNSAPQAPLAKTKASVMNKAPAVPKTPSVVRPVVVPVVTPPITPKPAPRDKEEKASKKRKSERELSPPPRAPLPVSAPSTPNGTKRLLVTVDHESSSDSEDSTSESDDDAAPAPPPATPPAGVTLSKGRWTKDELSLLEKLLEELGPKRYTEIARRMGTRTAAQVYQKIYVKSKV